MAKINWTFIVFILLVGMVLGGCGTSSDSSTQVGADRVERRRKSVLYII